ncbi:MAG: hypothetical protein WAM69_04645 [Candidatus Sulfotelmatobacter sp.]
MKLFTSMISMKALRCVPPNSSMMMSGDVGVVLFDPGDRFFQDRALLERIHFGPDLLRGCRRAVGFIQVRQLAGLKSAIASPL